MSDQITTCLTRPTTQTQDRGNQCSLGQRSNQSLITPKHNHNLLNTSDQITTGLTRPTAQPPQTKTKVNHSWPDHNLLNTSDQTKTCLTRPNAQTQNRGNQWQRPKSITSWPDHNLHNTSDQITTCLTRPTAQTQALDKDQSSQSFLTRHNTSDQITTYLTRPPTSYNMSDQTTTSYSMSDQTWPDQLHGSPRQEVDHRTVSKHLTRPSWSLYGITP